MFNKNNKSINRSLKLEDNLNNLFTDTVALAIDAAVQRIKAFNSLHCIHKDVIIVQAFTEVEKEFGVDLSGWKKLLLTAENSLDESLVNYGPSQIAEKLSKQLNIKFTVKQINKLLKEYHLQYKDHSSWKLTDAGKQYGTIYQSGNNDVQIRWKPTVVNYLEDSLMNDLKRSDNL